MEKNLYGLLRKLNQHQNALSKLLVRDSRHYYQILKDVERENLPSKLLLCRDFKTAQQILSPQEFDFLYNQSEIRYAYDLIEQIEFNLSFDLCDAFQSGRLHYSYNDLFCENVKNQQLARALIFPHENSVIDVIIPAIASCFGESSQPESKNFLLLAETEFVACCYDKRCYVIRMVTDYDHYADIAYALRKRPVKFCLSPLTAEGYGQMQQDVWSFKKNLMLTFECHFNCLLPYDLGKLSLPEFIYEQKSVSWRDWMQIFQLLQNSEKFVSLKREYMTLLSCVEDFDMIFGDAKKFLSKYKVYYQQRKQSEEDDEELQRLREGVVAVSDDQRIAFYVYAKDEGWIVEIYVKNPLEIEFLTVKNLTFYIVKFVKNLRDVPRLVKTLAKFSPA